MLNRTVEFVTLHRDVGENELKQGRELREGGVMDFVDSAAVRAAKNGSLLVLESVERAERGVLPILNNLLENREMVAEYPSSSIESDTDLSSSTESRGWYSDCFGGKIRADGTKWRTYGKFHSGTP